MEYTYEDIAKMIDHSLLNPALTAAEMERGCRLALDYDVASVCILPYYLRRCAQMLAGSQVKAGTTIGFPHGCHTTAVKVAEAERALADGGQELDVVVNISAVLSGDWRYVRDDLGGGDRGYPRRWAKSESDFRKLLPERCAEDPAVRDLERVGCRLGEDLHRIRQRRRHHRRPGADAEACRAASAGEVRRRNSRSGRAAGGARGGCDALRRHPYGIDVG